MPKPAYFKCIYGAGNAHAFTAEYDIKEMRNHRDYVEIDEAEYKTIVKKFASPQKAETTSDK